MGARIRVLLNPEEDRTLFELRTATTVPQRVKDRAEALRLRARLYVEKIADYLNWAPQTVRETIHRWNTKVWEDWEGPGRGGNPWQEADMAHLEKCLELEPRTYNSHQLAQKLANDRKLP
jgi:hypothetical protein